MMVHHSLNEMLVNDIDWFFKTSDDKPIHVASAGGLLPKVIKKDINCKILNQVRKIQVPLYDELIRSFDDKKHWLELLSKVDINKSSLHRVETQQAKFRSEKEANELFAHWQEEYLVSFCSMAKCGFLSFDRMNIEDCMDNRYQWIADGTSINLNDEINKILPEIKIGVEQLKNEDADWIEMLNNLR